MENKGQLQIASVAIAVLVFLIVMTVYGSVSGALNFGAFTAGVTSLIALLPLVLVGSAIIGIVVVAFRLAQ